MTVFLPRWGAAVLRPYTCQLARSTVKVSAPGGASPAPTRAEGGHGGGLPRLLNIFDPAEMGRSMLRPYTCQLREIARSEIKAFCWEGRGWR
jgi:hypothetical protein